jgi:very-short-patch-repair endonuclease
MTKVEWYVWSRLRNRQVAGCKFRRQVPIGPYFADFLCHSARLVIEVDGAGHEQERDDRKDSFSRAQGYRVVRIPATDVDESIDQVMDGIYDHLTSESPGDAP